MRLTGGWSEGIVGVPGCDPPIGETDRLDEGGDEDIVCKLR